VQQTSGAASIWCGWRESNPHTQWARDFKSLASTNFATSASTWPVAEVWRGWNQNHSLSDKFLDLIMRACCAVRACLSKSVRGFGIKTYEKTGV
jgi:hypothetical protein